MKQHKHKVADYSDDTNPRNSKYALERKQGCEVNHARHIVPVVHCSLCNPGGANKLKEEMMAVLTNPELKQYGMDGWEKHFEYMVTCEKCGDSFLSNEAGKALCNGRVYTGCPYCATDKEE